MDLATLLQRLPKTHGRHHRDNALSDLLHQLDSHDVRHLQSLLKCITFQFDIVASLPLELVALIFSHVDPVATCRLRLVSLFMRSRYTLTREHQGRT